MALWGRDIYFESKINKLIIEELCLPNSLYPRTWEPGLPSSQPTSTQAQQQLKLPPTELPPYLLS